MTRTLCIALLLPHVATAATITNDVELSGYGVVGITDNDTTDSGVATAHAASDETTLNVVSATATGSDEGLLALHAEFLGVTGETDSAGYARATATWSETFVSESDSKEYAIYLDVPAIDLRIYDNCFCGINPDMMSRMRASYDIEIALDGTPVWESSATAEGGVGGHRLVTDGVDLGNVSSGVATDFSYTVGPYDTSIPLGTFPTDQSFTVTATVMVRAWTPYLENLAQVTLGNTDDLLADSLLIGLAGPRLAVSPRALEFDEVVVNQSATQALVLESVGQEDLIVSGATLTDSHFSMDPSYGDDPCVNLSPTLAPGESCTIGVGFAPDALGLVEDTLTLSSNSVYRPTREIPLSGYGWSAFGTWMRTYGGFRADYATGVVQAADGGYLVVGNTHSFGPGGADIWVLRLRPDGSVVWQKVIGAEGNDAAGAVERSDDGTFIIAGSTSSFSADGSAELWLLELADNGEILWEGSYGGGHGGTRTLALTTDGNFLVGGYNPVVTKVSRDGILWRRSFDRSRLGNVAAMPGGGGVFSVHAYGYGGSSTVGFYELDAEGNVVWARSLDGVRGEFCSIQPAMDGGFLLTSDGYTPLDGAAIVKLGVDLEVDWAFSYGARGSSLLGTRPTADGGWLSQHYSRDQAPHGWMLIKLSASGEIGWQQHFDAKLADFRPTADGGYVMAGSRTTIAGADLVVVKTDPSGAVPECEILTEASMAVNTLSTVAREASPILSEAPIVGVETDHPIMVWDTAAVPDTACLGTGTQTDSDGVPDVQEMGPDGLDAGYDGNGDNVADVDQANVASFHAGNGEYVTLATDTGILENVQSIANPSPPSAPPGVAFAYDFFSFTLSVPVGGAATVTLTLHEATPPETFYKYGRSPDLLQDHWYEFPYDGQTGAEIDGNVVTLHLIDGERGDVDVEANGVIVEPGGPAWQIPEPVAPGPFEVGDKDEGCGCNSTGLPIALAGALLFQRRRKQ